MPPSASAYGGYGDDNPFVEAMLRMMEIFGLINRDRLPLNVPYLPGYGGLGSLGSLPGTVIAANSQAGLDRLRAVINGADPHKP